MPERVVLLAIDGLDWDRLRQGMRAGWLPQFQALFEQSAWAEVPVFEAIPCLTWPVVPDNSPTLWTTIASGVYYFQHGVDDFCNLRAGPEPKLFESSQVAAPRIWDVLTAYDLPSIVVGYYITHPAYPIKGVMVSDMFGEVASRDVVCPPERHDELARLLGADSYAAYVADQRHIGCAQAVVEDEHTRAADTTAQAVGRAVLREFSQLDDAAIETLLRSSGDPQRRVTEYRLIYPYVRDSRCHRLLLDLLGREPWSFATAYYRFIDFVSHGFWPNTDWRHPAQQLGNVLERAYACMDRWVGEARALLSPEDRLIVMSDHGFKAENAPDPGESRSLAEANLGTHREPAVFMATGGSARGQIKGVGLLDVAPTILDYLGIPQAETLDGGPVPGLLAPDAPQSRPRIAAFPYRPPVRAAALTGAEEQAVLARLTALGYIE
jgi:predicted AlkP superfamily phosphohydrolase/phosphomutase